MAQAATASWVQSLAKELPHVMAVTKNDDDDKNKGRRGVLTVTPRPPPQTSQSMGE